MLLNKLNSLKLKLLAILAPGATLALILAFTYTIIKAEEQFEADLEAKTSNLKNFADIIAEPLWNFNTLRVEKILDTMMLDADLQKIEVTDEGHNLILKRESTFIPGTKTRAIELPIVYSNAHITQEAGLLRINLGEARLIAEKKEFIFTAINALLLIYLVLMVSIWITFTRILDKPIKQLMSAINSYRSAQVFSQVDHSSNDELGQISKAFNQMQESLEAHHSQLRKSKEHLQNLYHSTPSLLFSFDSNGIIQDASNYFLEQMSFDRADIIGLNFCNLLATSENRSDFSRVLSQLWSDIELNEIPLQIVNGKEKTLDVMMDATLSANLSYPGALAVITDITSLNKAHRELEHHATTDYLSGIANRYSFQQYLEQLIEQRQKNQHTFALMFIDLDHFKSVNDIFGHNTGDELICMASSRINSVLRPQDKIARLGGDEFAVIIHDVSTSNEVEPIAERLISSIKDSFYLQQSDIYISASVGIALFPTDSSDPTELLKYADLAMYRAKDEGRSRFAFYNAKQNKEVVERLHIERLLRNAITNNALELHYQPIISLHSNRVEGMEMLLRLKDNTRIISPNQFIPIAEETGIIIEIGEWCIKQGLKQLAQWHRQLDSDLYLSINVSTRQFQSKNFIQVIQDSIKHNAIPSNKVLIEITESLLLLDNQHNLNIFNQLKSIGCNIAIDDFGTGYSSLSYLMKFPIDTLKIDRSFIKMLSNNAPECSLIKAIVQMAEGMHLKVIAEGVESVVQSEILKELSPKICAQGFLYSKPVTQKTFEEQHALINQAPALIEHKR